MADGLEIRVYKYNVSEDFTRTKLYTAEDVTSSVLQPITEVERTDTALDTCNITIINKDENPIKPFTRFRIDYTQVIHDVGETDHTYWLVDNDSVELAKYSASSYGRAYKHTISLIEPTKWLERFDVDNTTVTNMLMFLYQDAGVPSGESAFNYETGGTPHTIGNPPTYTSELKSNQYANNNRFLSITSNNTGAIECSCRMTSTVRFYMLGVIHSDVTATISTFRVKKPDGTYDTLATSDTSYTTPVDGNNNHIEGKYVFEQVYTASKWGMNWTITFTWEVEYKALVSYSEKLPHRFTMAEVVDRVLAKVTRENSICLENETPLFQLDTNQRETLTNMVAPEFTFTQSTLFDILMQIGIAMHAIPRLVVADADTTGTLWNTIHFDFLGGESNAMHPEYPQVSYEKTQRSENYATAYVSNVQNAFVSSNSSYITITEPFSNGYISARTESSDFEISKDHNCIKTSRPIQRITELWVKFWSGYGAIDIAPYCKERADYNLLTDYQYSSVASLWGLGTKETNIYYTRGDNVIRGLDYIASNSISVAPSYGKQSTIKNLLIMALQQKGFTVEQAKNMVTATHECDYGYRIKYVPYLNMKVKQFRDVIEDEMETSTLFFNQNGQQVDINAFGERIKASLNMTCNQEPTMSFVSKYRNKFKMSTLAFRLGGKIGQYIPYEVRREISAKSTTTSIVYSKDFNKWNEYDAIKKNYREWEISENECIEQNPIYNQFCLLSDDIDIEEANNVDYNHLTPSEKIDFDNSLTAYETELSNKEGFIASSKDIMESIFRTGTSDISIEWMMAQTFAKEWSESTGEYSTIKSSFLIPTTAVAIGNAVVINVGTKDNYSAGTYTELPANFFTGAGYRLERDIQYGSKYGNAEKMRLKLGSGNYAQLGDLMAQAKELYKLPDATVENTTGTIAIWSNPLMIDKDSRQQINLTMQLNFISEKDYIWISTRLANRCGFVGNTASGLKFAFFKKTPSRFFNNNLVENVDYVVHINDYVPPIYKTITTIHGDLSITTPTYMVAGRANVTEAPFDAVGWGILDSENKLVLYYNKAIKKNKVAPPVYFQFRDRI